MGETDKPFACPLTECGMRFTNEDHLTVHKKKHDMCLNFGNGQKMNMFADQTPTPTRFIRNCEEVGLFQDLQNVNPFEEQFRKAADAVKSGSTPLHEVEPMCGGQPDDTLHTPQVFSHIQHHHHPVPRVSQSPPPPAAPTLQLPPSQQQQSRSDVHVPPDTDNVYHQTLARDTSVQLLLRLPDGKVVRLSAVEMAETDGASAASIHSSTLLTAPSVILDQPTSSGQTSRTVLLSSAPRSNSLLTTPTTPRAMLSTTSDRMALAKQRLKQTLSANLKKASNANIANAQQNKVTMKEGKTLLTLKTLIPERSAANPLQAPKRSRELSGSTGSSGDESQVKRQRFLERNRAAATRCRQKRKHWVSTLERRSDVMHSTNQQLVAEVAALRAEVAQLKTLLLAHRDCPVTKAMCQAGVLRLVDTSVLDSESTVESMPSVTHISQPLHTVINVTSAPSSDIVILHTSAAAAPVSKKKQAAFALGQSSLTPPTLRPLIIPIHEAAQIVNRLNKDSSSQNYVHESSISNDISHIEVINSNSQPQSTNDVLKFAGNVYKETVIVENISTKRRE